MTRMVFAAAAVALAFSAAPAAMAASDYLLELDGVDGAAPATIEIQSWSWGATNSNAGSATGTGTGRLRESPSLPSRYYTTKSGRVAAGDVNGDGTADLAAAPEVQGFSLSFDKSSPQLLLHCTRGSRLGRATIRAGGESYELLDATVTDCTDTSRATAGRNSMPNRISMNVTTPRQTQGATFGERCLATSCAAAAEVRMTISGQLKHTKSGHVTLLK